MDVEQLTLIEAKNKLQKKEISSVELIQGLLQRVDLVDDKIKAINDLDRQNILEEAQKSDDRRIANNSLGDYDGLPITIKENIVIKGKEARCGSSILNGLKNIYDATVIKKIKESGGIIFGQANMDEFAMGSTTQTSKIQLTSNPYNLQCVPGGSSGGSAACVGANESLGSLGSDTGGSIRQPASFCGVVGLKPSYGRVSRNGLISFASSLDQIGPITKNVEDSAFLLNLLAGYDKFDSTSLKQEKEDFLEGISKLNVKNLKVAVPEEYFNVDGISPDVRKTIQAAIDLFKDLGASVDFVSLPHSKYAIPVYYILATAEASVNLARYDGLRYGQRGDIKDLNDTHKIYSKIRSEGFGKEVKRRILLGTFVLSSGYSDAYYKNALKVRNLIKQDFSNAFKKYDVLISPVAPTTAFRKDDNMTTVEKYLSDIFTAATNIAGISGISVPAGYDSNSMPIGLQIIAPSMQENLLLQTAYCFENNLNLTRKKPVI